MKNKLKKAFYIFNFTFLILFLLSCTKPEPTNPYDPQVNISVSNLQYQKLAINKIKLTWENYVDISSGIFKIDKKVGTNSWQEEIAEIASDVTTWIDNNAELNHNLQYRMQLRIGDNSSNNVESEVIDNVIPTPENLVYTIQYFSGSTYDVHLDWDYNMSGIEGFKIKKNGTLMPEIIPAETTEWIDGGVTMGESYTYQVLAFYQSYNSVYSNVISLTISLEGMIFIQGGTFDMGDHFNEGGSDELPVHSVTLDDFEIGIHEVTQTEYEAVVGSNPAHNYGVGDDYPVYYVDWYDAVTFCNLKSQQEGLTPCYNLSDWSCDFSVDGYRLPTEAEWEYTARGGPNWEDNYKYSGTTDNLEDYAWYSSNSSSQTHEVGTKQPNQFDIYDMSGNVWEWCNDWYSSSYYSSSPSTNPTGSTTGSYRVSRGGCWNYYAYDCRVAARNSNHPSVRYGSGGFRIARTP